MTQELVRRAFDVFQAEHAKLPATTLRSANAIDSHQPPIPYEHGLDDPTDAYLEHYTFWGQAFLDPDSWRYYLPHWIQYVIQRSPRQPGMVVDGVLASLRPPDREPARLASLTPAQEAVVVAFLQYVAARGDAVPQTSLARQVLEEWWLPNARYRTHGGAGA